MQACTVYNVHTQYEEGGGEWWEEGGEDVSFKNRTPKHIDIYTYIAHIDILRVHKLFARMKR